MHVEAWLQRAAAARPDAIAIEAPDGVRSYAQLLADARAGAVWMRERGAADGQRVAIALPPGLAFAQALHACMLLGAVAVPVDLRLTGDERKRIAAGAALLVERPLEVDAGDLALYASDGKYQATDSDVHMSGGGLEARVAEADRSGNRHALRAPAVVIYTSGTTSAPKAVELTYGNLLWSALGSAVALGLDPRERWLCALPLSHVGGLSILIRSAIYGTTAVVHERFETERVLQSLREQGITLVSLVATTLARLLDAGLREPPALRCALTGGGPVAQALVQRARQAGVPVRETYGLTECGSQAATAPGEADRPGAGVPLFCTAVQLAADGEILLSGPTVAPGALAPDGLLHTGDLGHLDEHGFLHVTGRKADTIVSGGENVSPTEVEAAIEAHPQVIEAAVLARPDEQWGEAVHAIVVVAPGLRGEDARADTLTDDEARAPLDEERLRAHCAARLAPFKVPKRFTLVSQPLPRTRSGKLLRRELQ